jgi:hypothetical protein
LQYSERPLAYFIISCLLPFTTGHYPFAAIILTTFYVTVLPFFSLPAPDFLNVCGRRAVKENGKSRHAVTEDGTPSVSDYVLRPLNDEDNEMFVKTAK